MPIDLVAKMGRPNFANQRIQNVIAQPGNTTATSETVFNVGACGLYMNFHLDYTAGALAGGQTLDVFLDVAMNGIDFVPWFQFVQLAAATPPRQRQVIRTQSLGYGVGVTDNAAFIAGINSFYPSGAMRVRGVLTAGAGTPSYAVFFQGA